MHDTLITGGLVVTGSSAAASAVDIAIDGAKIAAIAPPGRLEGARVIDARGQIVSPGFVDMHSHADYTMLLDGRAHSAVLQGITSLAVGNCGGSIAPVSDRSKDLLIGASPGWRTVGELPISWRSFGDYLSLLRDRGVGPNVFPLIAHGAMRLGVAGFDDRPVSRAELSGMQSYLHEAMAAGALGFSTGLEYAPGISSSQAELVGLAEAMRDFAGLYATHCRNRSDAMDLAASEAIAIARAGKARLQLSHFIRRPYAPAGMVEKTWSIIEEARSTGLLIHADAFPFDYGPTPLSVLIPPALRAPSRAAMAERLRDPSFRSQVLAGLGLMFDNLLKNDLVNSMYVACDGADGELNGLSLAQISSRTGLGPAETAYWLLENSGEDFGTVMIVENWARWDDLVSALSDPNFFIMGDGCTENLNGPASNFTMSLSDWGYAPKFISQFVRDMKICTLESAIYRMATGPARQLGLKDRGEIAIGQAADIVVFDLDRIGTAVAPDALRELPSGIDHVFINGTLVVDGGRVTNARPGIVGQRR